MVVGRLVLGLEGRRHLKGGKIWAGKAGEGKTLQLVVPQEQRLLIQERPGHQGAGWPAGGGGTWEMG